MVAQKHLKDPEIKEIIVMSPFSAQLAQITQHFENPWVSPDPPGTREPQTEQDLRSSLGDNICERKKRKEAGRRILQPVIPMHTCERKGGKQD